MASRSPFSSSSCERFMLGFGRPNTFLAQVYDIGDPVRSPEALSHCHDHKLSPVATRSGRRAVAIQTARARIQRPAKSTRTASRSSPTRGIRRCGRSYRALRTPAPRRSSVRHHICGCAAASDRAPGSVWTVGPIHPRFKHEVGRRLATALLKNVSGPTIAGCAVTQGTSIEITLDAARMGGEDVAVQPFDTNVSACKHPRSCCRPLPLSKPAGACLLVGLCMRS